MKALYLLIVPLFLSHSLFIMQLSSLFKRSHLKNIPIYRQKRNLSNCLCAEKAKQDLLYKKTISSYAISENASILNSSYNFVANREKLQQENIWPISEGLALEDELKSGRYCANFGRCAYKSELEESRIIGIMTASAITGIPCIILDLTGVGNGVGTITLGSIALCNYLYFAPKFNQLVEKRIALTHIADLSLHRLEPIYYSFVRALNDASADKKLKEFSCKKC